MKDLATLVAMGLLLLIVFPAPAQDQAQAPAQPPDQAQAPAEPVDIENAKTPMHLPDLLAEGGIDAVDVDVWLMMEMIGDDPQPAGPQMYMHLSVKPVDGQLVFEAQQGSADANGFSNHRRLVYDADGKLASYESTMGFGHNSGAVTTGKIEGDQLVLTTTGNTGNPDGDTESRTRKIPLEKIESAIVMDWLPLVFAYHIRQGHLGYHFPMADFVERDQIGMTTVQDLGTEIAEHEGKEVKAHLLSVTIRQADAGDGAARPEQKMKILVLENGEMMRIDVEQGQGGMRGRRTTEQEVTEEFGLDKAEAQEGAGAPERAVEPPSVDEAPRENTPQLEEPPRGTQQP